MRDRQGRAPRSQSQPPPGSEKRGMYARVAQEPGMESRRSCIGQARNGKRNRAGRASRGRSAQYEL